jgi:hypothetical protein
VFEQVRLDVGARHEDQVVGMRHRLFDDADVLVERRLEAGHAVEVPQRVRPVLLNRDQVALGGIGIASMSLSSSRRYSLGMPPKRTADSSIGERL